MSGGTEAPPELPAWLEPGNGSPAPHGGRAGRGSPALWLGWRRRRGFLWATLDGLGRLASGLREEPSKGRLAGLDPGARLLGVFLLVLGASLSRSWAGTGTILVGTVLAGTLLGGSPARYLRLVVVALLASLLVAAPAATSLVSPGRELVGLAVPLGPAGSRLALTLPGALAAARLVLRAGASVSSALLLRMAVPELGRGLQRLGVPRGFRATLELALRYLVLLAREAESAYMARRARSLGGGAGKEARRFVARSAATLIMRAERLSEEVGRAMTARGYRGDWPRLEGSSWGWREGLWVGAAACLSALALLN